jgi:hypothetical protein
LWCGDEPSGSCTTELVRFTHFPEHFVFTVWVYIFYCG